MDRFSEKLQHQITSAPDPKDHGTPEQPSPELLTLEVMAIGPRAECHYRGIEMALTGHLPNTISVVTFVISRLVIDGRARSSKRSSLG
jgi:hypothetical protein